MLHAEVSCLKTPDLNWQTKIKELSLVNYTGIDIVPFLIAHHSRMYAGVGNLRFAPWDMAKDPLPQGVFDLIMTRDMVQHNSLEDGLKIFKNIEKSGARYLLTNFHTGGKNEDITPGGYYLINPLLPPFSFPKPLLYIREGGSTETTGKYIVLFKIDGEGSLVGKGSGNAIEVSNSADKSIFSMDAAKSIPDPRTIQL